MIGNRKGLGSRLKDSISNAVKTAREKLSQVMKGKARSGAGGRMSTARLDASQTPIRSSAASNQNTAPNRPGQKTRAKFRAPFSFTHKKRFIAIGSGVLAAVMIPVIVTSAGGAGFYQSSGGTVNYAVPNHADTISGSTEARAVTAYSQAVVRAETESAEETENSAQNAGGTSSGESASAAASQPADSGGGTSSSGTDTASQSEATESQSAYMDLQPGIHSEEVIALQQRLMDLHYLENDEPTDYYGPQTQQAVGYFQRKHGLTVDGLAGRITQEALFSDQARPYTVTTGQSGADIWTIQERLEELGYPVAVTGYYGSQTSEAVAFFQRMCGLTDDGTVGTQTKDRLFSDSAVPAPTPEPTPEPTPDPTPVPEENNGAPAADNAGSQPAADPAPAAAAAPAAPADNGAAAAAQAAPAPTPKPTPKPADNAGSNVPAANAGSVEAFVQAACAQEGKPYVLGGKGPNVFDCSGLVYYALNASGYKIGYMTSGGWAASGYPSISWNNLQRGDVVCMKGHVAVYLGGGMMCDASSSNGRIMIRSMGNWARNNFICGKRPLAA